MDFGEYDYALSFQERMEAGREASRRSLDRRSYLGAAVTWRKPRLRLWWTVEQVSLWLRVSDSRVKLLCATKRIKGARRTSQGKGRPWRIPAFRQPDGDYAPLVSAGKRGPVLRIASEREEVPF